MPQTHDQSYDPRTHSSLTHERIVEAVDVIEDENHQQLETAKQYAERYKVSLPEAVIMVERQKVYGEPKKNHHNIAQMIAPILQPHVNKIAKGEPIPEWAVALVFCQLKMSRMRWVFHDDNFIDLSNYAGFARAWQKEDEQAQKGMQIIQRDTTNPDTFEPVKFAPSRPDYMECLREFHERHGAPKPQRMNPHQQLKVEDVAMLLESKSQDMLTCSRKATDSGKSDLANRFFRMHLMLEELAEVIRAFGSGDEVELADGLTDLLYVTVGSAL